MQVLIVADDLTGALDSAVAFAAPGRHVAVARRPGDVPAALALAPDVLAVSTASREGTAAAAREAIAATVAAIAGPLPAMLLKKVDSRLKGHVADEVAALAALASRSGALVAPAIPALGRVVAHGCVTGAGVERPIPVAPAVGLAGATVPDTRSDADLDTVLAAALDAPSTPLLVGAAGLAAALARRLGGRAAPRPRLATPILFAIGSHDPITLAQVAALERAGLPASLAPDGRCPPGGAGLVRLVAAPGTAFDPRTAGARFATGIAARLATGEPATLLACGGETADAILAEIGVGVIRIEGEILPGVPVSTMLLGQRSLQLVTKSGGFGGPDTLVSVLGATRVSGRGPLEGAT